MALQDIESAPKISFEDCNGAAEFEAGLASLMPYLRDFARSLSGKRDVGEDLAQAAVIKAWRSRRSFAPGSNLKAWLTTILRNEYFSYRRRAWRQVPWDAELAETICTPPGEQQWTVELSDTAHAMRSLPTAQREALILVGVGGYSHEDAALLANCAVGTVKSRVGRARRSLRLILDGGNTLPLKSPRAHGNPVDEILAQLQHFILGGTRTASAATSIH
jgi:RNA polymerase sigma-70 factor, ECF subfamily